MMDRLIQALFDYFLCPVCGRFFWTPYTCPISGKRCCSLQHLRAYQRKIGIPNAKP